MMLTYVFTHTFKHMVLKGASVDLITGYFRFTASHRSTGPTHGLPSLTQKTRPPRVRVEFTHCDGVSWPGENLPDMGCVCSIYRGVSPHLAGVLEGFVKVFLILCCSGGSLHRSVSRFAHLHAHLPARPEAVRSPGGRRKARWNDQGRSRDVGTAAGRLEAGGDGGDEEGGGSSLR